MIKKLSKLLSLLLFTFIIYVFLSSPEIIISSVNYSINIFCTNLLPTMFPFFILVDFLINYDYISLFKQIFKFKYSYIILLSLISGLPSNAKYIKGLLDTEQISTHDAEILLSVTFFPNPMFVISSVGLLMMGSTRIGLIALISVYISNFIIYILNYRNLHVRNTKIIKTKKKFSSLLSESIISNARTMLVILGTISFFIILLNIIVHYIPLNIEARAIISGIMEMTSGIKNMSTTLLSTEIKYIYISLFLSFSGLSILMQAFNILSDYKLNIKLIIKNKLLVTLTNFIINYFYIIFFM